MPEKGARCCIKDCFMRTFDKSGKRINETIQLFSIPKVKTNNGSQMKDVTTRRRLAWVSAINLKEITFEHSRFGARVCSRHFHKGKSLYFPISL